MYKNYNVEHEEQIVVLKNIYKQRNDQHYYKINLRI